MITVHHLETSRSTRILWLLEELGVAYDMVRHPRDHGRAPASLGAVNSLGKAPIIVDGDLVLSESSAILRYIDARYGAGRFSPPAGIAEGALHDQWLDFAEGSAMLPIMILLIGRLGGDDLPKGMAAFATSRLEATFRYLEDGIGGRPYLVGDRLTLADIQMSYTIEIARVAGLLADYPKLRAYLDRLNEEPGLRKAIAVGGPMSPETWG